MFNCDNYVIKAYTQLYTCPTMHTTPSEKPDDVEIGCYWSLFVLTAKQGFNNQYPLCHWVCKPGKVGVYNKHDFGSLLVR